MAIGLVQAPAALAAFTCADTDATGTVQGPVTVPSGTSCSMFNAIVNGSVTVQSGAHLDISDSTINGNLIYNDPANTNAVCGKTVITGNLVVTNAGPDAVVDIGPGTASCGGDPVTIRGNVSFNASRAGSHVGLGGATVGNNVSVTNNRGETIVDSNKIGNVLNCTGNIPPPSGGTNTARLFAGQCVGFGGGGGS